MAERPRLRAIRGRLGGVRVRAALAATVVVAIVLALASVAFVLVQRRQLESTVTEATGRATSTVAAQVAAGGAGAADLRSSGAGEQILVQVVSGASVLLSSPAIEGEPPLVDARPGPGEVVTMRVDSLPVEDEAFTVVARGVTSPAGPLVVLGAGSLESAQRATKVLVAGLASGLPVLLLTVAGTSYWLTGLALAPVTAMRRRVARITATDLSARVPVPASGDEIASLATTMNAMLDRLRSGTEAQRRFVADASHELRSPLATIRAAHEIATAHPEAADWTAVHADVLAEVERLERLVADLLFLARSDEHGPALHRTDVDLDDLVTAEALRLRRTTDLHVVVRATPVRVTGDPHHLSRALRNLTDNAARHATTRVELHLDHDTAHARIEVVDDGPGIPPEDRERIFQRFVRLEASRHRRAGGTGLGLSIAQEIARSHDGDLTVLEHAGGARFVFLLPLPVPHVPAAAHD